MISLADELIYEIKRLIIQSHFREFTGGYSFLYSQIKKEIGVNDSDMNAIK